MIKIGDCRNDSIIDDIFGSVSEFARLIEEFCDEFNYGKYTVTYNEDIDIHYFWS